MITKVYLDGPLGEKFGAEWELDIASPIAAIRMIDANVPGIMKWIRDYSLKYTHYQVVVEYESGTTESLSEDQYVSQNKSAKCKMKSIRFVPIIGGAGKWTQAIIGAVMVVVGLYTNNSALTARGAGMLFTGVISALLTQTKNVRLSSDQGNASKALLSEAFDGPTNTTDQGVPIPLIYGRCLVGSRVISAGLVVA